MMIRPASLFMLALAVSASAQLGALLEPVVPAPRFAQNSAAQLDRVVRRLQVESGRHVLDSDGLLRAVEKELAGRFGVNGQLQLSLVRPWPAVSLPAQDFDVTIVEAPATGLSSSFLVTVRVVSAAEEVGQWALAVRAQLWQEVWAANGRIERGQTLDRTLLTVQKVDVLRDRQAFIMADVEPSTLETAQAITSPRVLVRRDIAERPLVRKGQVIEVVAKQGLLAISMKALALEDGAAGALIRLRNLQSQKEFSAQILHENKAQVQF